MCCKDKSFRDMCDSCYEKYLRNMYYWKMRHDEVYRITGVPLRWAVHKKPVDYQQLRLPME